MSISVAPQTRMSSLSFIPRKLTKRTSTQPEGTSTTTTPPGVSISAPAVSSSNNQIPVATQETPPKYNDQDYANLILLSLSDYAIWLDAELREKIGHSSSASKEDPGYISLNYLLKRSTALASLLDTKPGLQHKTILTKVQTALAKGIRSHASHLLDVRLLLHPDETVPRFGKQKEVLGGYEVRRKHMSFALRTKSEWDARTLYVENIPPGFRSYAGIMRFLYDLLYDIPPVPSSFPTGRVQGISLPPHHNDKPDSRPSCKGFALVTFAHETDCEHLKVHWPWIRESSNNPKTGQSNTGETDKIDSATETLHQAREYNFRVITKERWLQLKAEYLTYRKKLVDEMNAYQDSRQAPPRRSGAFATHDTTRTDLAPRQSTSTCVSTPELVAPTPSLSRSSPYPPNCLVFVRHVHPETNKTTLRNLLSQAFSSEKAQLSQKNEGLDYVDFNKGIDTCYLRLSTPRYSAALIDYFNNQTRKIVQTSGMDGTGTDISSKASSSSFQDLKPIIVERVTGMPEEFYWERVPEKVRRAAVEKAVQLMEAESRQEDHGNLAGQKRALGEGSDQKSGSVLNKKRRKL